MTMESNYRRYRISDWSQLADCRSNSSKDLRISVTEYINNPDIEGTQIEVRHPKYGTLMAYIIKPVGNLTLPLPRGTDNVMTSSILLNELKRYGFYVEYREERTLPPGQIELINSAKSLGGRKLRLMRVYDSKDPEVADVYVVAFDPGKVPDWMNSGYSCSKTEFMEVLYKGHAFNLSTMAATAKYRWDWLYNAVYDVYALLDEVAEGGSFEETDVPLAPDPIVGSSDPSQAGDDLDSPSSENEHDIDGEDEANREDETASDD